MQLFSNKTETQIGTLKLYQKGTKKLKARQYLKFTKQPPLAFRQFILLVTASH